MINALRLCLALAAGATASKVTLLAPLATSTETKALESRLRMLGNQLTACKKNSYRGCDKSIIHELRRYISLDANKAQTPESLRIAKKLLEEASTLELELLAKELDYCVKNPPYQRSALALWEHPRGGCLQDQRERSISALESITKDAHTPESQRNQAEKILRDTRTLDNKYTKEIGL